MRFIKRLLGINLADEMPLPDVLFGRYTDAHKTDQNYDAWDKSIQSFEKEKYMDSLVHFLEYLRDDSQQNISYTLDKGLLKFQIFQGSKWLQGYANETIFKAQAKIAKATELHVGFMRRLLDQNFALKYSRFCLDPENDICIVFDSQIKDASPYKLYYALKELALNADKHDDLLLDEFDSLKPVNTGHVRLMEEHEINVKLKYLRTSIEEIMTTLEKPEYNMIKLPGAAAYLFLDLAYRLDYLLRPEVFVLEKLEKVTRIFFSMQELPLEQRVVLMKKEFETILKRSDDAMRKEFYKSSYTFGITTPVNHDRLQSFIDGELNNMDWYENNNYSDVALAVPGYIMGYSMFNFSVPEPDIALLHLYFEITNQKFFNDLGFNMSFVDPDGKLNKRQIKSALEKIETLHTDRYLPWKFPFQELKLDSMLTFSRSFLMIIRQLNIRRK